MVGLVVGATGPGELAAIRAIAPGLAFLVPGVGAQGGDLEATLAAGPATAPPTGARPGGGLLVNVSRGITAGVGTAAAEGESSDPGERIAASAAEWASRLPVLR
jgi:orotidine-5'-phosphate decarboxylase